MTGNGSGPRVGFLSELNYYSRDAFSGILLKMHEALVRQGVSVVDLGKPFRPNLLTRVTGKLGKVVGGRAASVDVSKKQAVFADLVRGQIAAERCDVVFAPVASTELALVQPSVPVIYASDATYRIAAPMYFADHSEAERNQCEANERRSIELATELVYTSQWAADSAINDYGADPSRITIVPFGANLITEPDRTSALRRQPASPLRILFLGRDWFRKGGSIVEATHAALTNRGIAAHLKIVGCCPPGLEENATRQIIPFLSKDTASGRAQFDALWQSTDLLFLPTRGDTFGVVFCEAAAHGVPSITANVGGTASAVADGVSGFVIPYDASPDDYADAISKLATDADLYQRFSQAARDRYETHLNWSAWGDRINEVIARIA